MFGWPVMLYCPADTVRTVPTNWSEVDFSDISYEMVPHPSIDEDPSAAFCRCKVHHFYVAMDQSVSYATNSPVVVRPLASQRTVYGRNAVFRATALGLPPFAYTWHKDGQPISDATNATFTLVSVVRADAGVYSVLVSNSAGTALGSATLSVQVPQRLTNPQFLSQGILQLASGYADGWPVSSNELSGFDAQASSDLLDWATLANSLTMSNGLLILKDTTSPDRPRRFYRILQP